MATEKQLFRAIKSALDTGFAALAISVGVKQNAQPVQQGVPSGPVILMELINHHRHGYSARTDVYVAPVPPATEGTFTHTESQVYESMFQLTCLSPQDPSNTGQLTAGDLANYASMIMQSDATITYMRGQGIGLERVSEVRNPKFSDDRDRFEATPSFDVILAHNFNVTSTNPMLQSEEFSIYRV